MGILIDHHLHVLLESKAKYELQKEGMEEQACGQAPGGKVKVFISNWKKKAKSILISVNGVLEKCNLHHGRNAIYH